MLVSTRRTSGRRAPGSTVAVKASLLTLALLVLASYLPASSLAAPVAPPGFFGVDTSANDSADFRAMAEADAGIVRMIFPFQVIKQGPDQPYNWGYSDNLVKSTADNGLDLLPIVYGAPPWISTDLNKTSIGPRTRGPWRELLRALVARYGPGGAYWAENPTVPYRPIGTWQIWNEPNSITWWGPRPRPREYGTLLRRSERAIHSVDPSAGVMTAGIVAEPTNPHAIMGVRYLQRLFAAKGVRKAVDAVGYHPYAPSTRAVKRQLGAARKVLRRSGARSIPIWITEIGWGSVGPRDHPLIKSPKAQERTLRRTFDMVLRTRRRLNIDRLLWYHWRDEVDDLCLWCESSGLLDERADPKPLLDTFRRIAVR